MSRWAKDGPPRHPARRSVAPMQIDYWEFLDELTEEQQADIRKRLYTAPNLHRNSGQTRHIPPSRGQRWRRKPT